MNIQNDKISFQSKIKFISAQEFSEKISTLNKKKHLVGYPWTPDSMKKGKNLYTTKIMDCIAGGIIDNGDITMFHLCTRNQSEARQTKQKGFDIETFKRRILDKINLGNDNLHGFIFGGYQLTQKSKYNVNKLNKIKKFYEENHIPYTIIGARKDVNHFGRFSILYSNKEDTLYITNSLSDDKGTGCGTEIKVKENSLVYNVYKRLMEKPGKQYSFSRLESNTEDFFKSQFNDVSVSIMDSFV